jgi:putative inorganic carbon (HCO3(-)) transporter
LFLPLLFSTTLTFNFWGILKSTFMHVLTLIMLSVWSFKVILSGEFKFRKTSLDPVVLLFLTVTAISTFLSVDLVKSFFGDYRRFEGLITFINYAAIFFITVNFVKNKKQINLLFLIWSFSALVISVYGVIQHFGLDWIIWENTSFETFRSFSTLGNPVKLGAYLVLTFPLILYLFLQTDSFYIRFFSVVNLSLIAVTLLFTYSRGGWLGFIVSIAFIGAFIPRKILLENKKWLLFLVTIIAGVVLIGNLIPHSLSKNFSIEERASSILKTDEGSAAVRIEVWKIAKKMIFDRPFFGFGLDTFRLVFPEYKTAKFLKLVGLAEYDRPHNDLLQVAISSGLIGLAVYLFMIVLFFVKGFKIKQLLQDQSNQVLIVLVLSSCIGYFVAIQFNFSTLETAGLFWFLMGLVLTFEREAGELKFDFKQSLNAITKTIFLGGILVLSLFFMFSVFRRTLADYYFKKGHIYQSKNLPDEAIVEYKKSVDANPYESLYFTQLASVYQGRALNSSAGESELFFQKAEKSYKEAIELSPRDIESRIQLAELYLNFNNTEKSIFYDEEVLKLDPFSIDAYVDLGIAFFSKGELSKAEDKFKKAIKIDPKNILPHQYLASVYEKERKFLLAIKEYEIIQKLDPDNEMAIQKLKDLKAGER